MAEYLTEPNEPANQEEPTQAASAGSQQEKRGIAHEEPNDPELNIEGYTFFQSDDGHKIVGFKLFFGFLLSLDGGKTFARLVKLGTSQEYNDGNAVISMSGLDAHTQARHKFVSTKDKLFLNGDPYQPLHPIDPPQMQEIIEPPELRELVHAFVLPNGQIIRITRDGNRSFQASAQCTIDDEPVDITNITVIRDGGTKTIVTSQGILNVPAPNLLDQGQKARWNSQVIEKA